MDIFVIFKHKFFSDKGLMYVMIRHAVVNILPRVLYFTGVLANSFIYYNIVGCKVERNPIG
jgi:hypothetical protein